MTDTKSTTTPARDLWVARLAGTQAEMGAQHGRLAATQARALLGFYRTLPEGLLAGDLPGVGGRIGRRAVRAFADAWQRRLARDRPAELAARSRAFVDAAIAAAAGGDAPLDRDAALRSYAAMDALQNCVAMTARAALGPFAPMVPRGPVARFAAGRARVAAAPACSSVIAWGRAAEDGELLFARNFDFPGVGVWDASPAFVVCAPTGEATPPPSAPPKGGAVPSTGVDAGMRYAFFTARGADTAVVTVVNEAGLVLAPHTRWHRGVRWGGAMIVDLVHDIARRAETIADAIAIARERAPSSSWGLAIGSARERTAAVLELAGGTLDVVRPVPGADYLVCANRYRTAALQAGEVAASTAWVIQSERRERRLHQLVAARTAPLTAATLIAMLGDRQDVAGAAPHRRRLGGVLGQPGNVHAAVVAPAHLRAWVGIDRAPCCDGTWAEVAWQWDGATGGWDGVRESSSARAAGFEVAARTDLAAPHDAATRHLYDAVRVYEVAHDVAAARASLERAVAADPDDSSLQLAAAWLAAEAGADDRAVDHVRAGLAHEADPYRRGQFLLWGSRAAAGRDPALARQWSTELAALSGDGLDELHAASRRRRTRPHPNLMMLDAY